MNNISASTIARTIVLFLALLNQVLTLSGLNPLDIAEEDVYQVVSLIVTIVAAIVNWWKNNSFTQKAIEADKQLKGSKKYEGEQEFTE